MASPRSCLPLVLHCLRVSCLLAGIGLSAQNTYYVNGSTGQDLPPNGASPATPWKTIGYALARIPVPAPFAGHVLRVAGGQDYGPGTNGEQFPIRVRANVALVAHGGPAALDARAAGIACQFDPGLDYPRATNRIEGITFRGGGVQLGGVPGTGQGPSILDCRFVGCGVAMVAAGSTVDPRIADCTFTGGPLGIAMTLANLPAPPAGSVNVDVERCRFEDVGTGMRVHDEFSFSSQHPSTVAVRIHSCVFVRGGTGLLVLLSEPCSAGDVRVQRSHFANQTAGIQLSPSRFVSSPLPVLGVKLTVEDSGFAGCRRAFQSTALGPWSYTPFQLRFHRNVASGPGEIGFDFRMFGVAGHSSIALSDNLVEGFARAGISLDSWESNLQQFHSLRDRCLRNGVGLGIDVIPDGGASIRLESGLFCDNLQHGISLKGTDPYSHMPLRATGLTIARNGTHGLFTDYRNINQPPPSFDHCIFAANAVAEVMVAGASVAPQITWSTLQGQAYPGPGNLNSTNPLLWPESYKLMPGSPCIDAGSLTVPAAATDYEGGARVVATRGSQALPDHGADEYQPAGSLHSYGIAGFGRSRYVPEIGTISTTARLGSPLSIELLHAIDATLTPATFALLSASLRESTRASTYPFDLGLLGAHGSWLWNDLALLVGPFGITAAGTASLTVTLPNSPQLVGNPLHCQWLTYKPDANAIGLVTTQGLRVTPN